MENKIIFLFHNSTQWITVPSDVNYHVILDHSTSYQTMLSTMSSPIFMILILQVDIREVKVSPKFQFFWLNPKPLINEIRQFLAYGRPFFSQICKNLHYLKSQKYKGWCSAEAFFKEPVGVKFVYLQ
jgi:hypothetical protein